MVWSSVRSQKQSERLRGNTYHTGKIASSITLMRMHMSRLGNKNCLGHRASQVTRMRQSKTQKDRWAKSLELRRKTSLRQRGKKNVNWQGGRSFEPYSATFNKELKELIRLRDSYICQSCGVSECETTRKLFIHHIDYDKYNCLPSNLITLCRVCNTKANFKRDYWTEYFRQRLNEMQIHPSLINKRDIRQRTRTTPGLSKVR